MRPRILVLALPALLAIALLASGCGGGGSESSTTTTPEPKAEEKPTLSKADFIREGDAICAEVNTAIGAIEESEAAETSSQTIQVANLYTGMVKGLQRLGQPSEKAGYSEFMGAAEELAMVEGETKQASDHEEVAVLEEASQKAVPAVEEFQSQAAVYGFEKCSEGPHPPAVSSSKGEEAGTGAEEESGGVEAAPEEGVEEAAPEEEFVPEEEAAPETGGTGGEIEEAAPEERAPEVGHESGGVGPG